MYIVHFLGSHTKRYDDPEEMGYAIAAWLAVGKDRKVQVELYI